MSAKTGAERQRRHRDNIGRYVTAIYRMLLELKGEMAMLRNEVANRHVTVAPPNKKNPDPKELTPFASPKGDALIPPQRRGTRLPADFEVSQEWKDEGRRVRERDGLPPINIDAEAAHFVDFWHAKAGKDGAKLDWLATWRNWCRSANGPRHAPAKPETNGNGHTTASPQELRAQHLADLAAKGIRIMPGGTYARTDD